MSGGRSLRTRRSVDVACGVLVIVIAALAFAVRFERPERHSTGDLYQYAIQAQRVAGIPDATAQTDANLLICQHAKYPPQANPSAQTCTYSARAANLSPRYVEIFTSRPLWPLILAPVIKAIGLINAIILTTAMAALLAALAVYLMLRRLGLTTIGATVGGAAISLLPTGYWSAKLLPEGAVLTTLVVVSFAAARVARGRPRYLAVLVPTLAALFAMKPANGAAAALALILSGLVLLPLARGRGAAWQLLGVGALGALGWVAVSRVLALPSFTHTLQDMATGHFMRPDVPNPLHVWAARNYDTWLHLDRVLGPPWPFVIVLPAALIAVHTLRRAGIVLTAMSLAAVAIVIAHPLASEYDRLISTAWLVVAASAGILADLAAPRVWRPRLRSAVAPEPAPVPPWRQRPAVRARTRSWLPAPPAAGPAGRGPSPANRPQRA